MNKHTEQEIQKLKSDRNIAYALAGGECIISSMSMAWALAMARQRELMLMVFYGGASAYLFRSGYRWMERAQQISQRIKELENKSR